VFVSILTVVFILTAMAVLGRERDTLKVKIEATEDKERRSPHR
jgi:hypothetical protein